MTEPRYVFREMHGSTVGHHGSSWQFLVLDSWDCYRPVLERHSGEKGGGVPELRAKVTEYCDVLNEPPLCRCGCGEELPVRYPMRPTGGPPQVWASRVCKDRVKT